jgi:ATP-binding cassette subfamily B protein
VEMTTVHPHDLHHAVAHVAQHPFVLESFSIRENLTIGATRDIPDAEAWRTLEDLGVAAAVRALPRGLDSVIGDEVRLSGGQSQLLVIARALLQQRPFVLLDEGTNQLDAEHEAKVAHALRSLRAHAAVLLITHRMTTARKADRIYVLDQGRIVQQGRHADLVEADGLYRTFWNLQVVE